MVIKEIVMKKEKCEHSNKKNLSSNSSVDGNMIEVTCLDCKARRYESRNIDGSITTSKWYMVYEDSRGKRYKFRYI